MKKLLPNLLLMTLVSCHFIHADKDSKKKPNNRYQPTTQEPVQYDYPEDRKRRNETIAVYQNYLRNQQEKTIMFSDMIDWERFGMHVHENPNLTIPPIFRYGLDFAGVMLFGDQTIKIKNEDIVLIKDQNDLVIDAFNSLDLDNVVLVHRNQVVLVPYDTSKVDLINDDYYRADTVACLRKDALSEIVYIVSGSKQINSTDIYHYSFEIEMRVDVSQALENNIKCPSDSYEFDYFHIYSHLRDKPQLGRRLVTNYPEQRVLNIFPIPFNMTAKAIDQSIIMPQRSPLNLPETTITAEEI